MMELGAHGFERSEFDVEYFAGFGQMTHVARMRRVGRQFNAEHGTELALVWAWGYKAGAHRDNGHSNPHGAPRDGDRRRFRRRTFPTARRHARGDLGTHRGTSQTRL